MYANIIIPVMSGRMKINIPLIFVNRISIMFMIPINLVKCILTTLF